MFQIIRSARYRKKPILWSATIETVRTIHASLGPSRTPIFAAKQYLHTGPSATSDGFPPLRQSARLPNESLEDTRTAEFGCYAPWNGQKLSLALRSSGLAGRRMTEAVKYSSHSCSFAILRGYIARPHILPQPILRERLFGISGARQPGGKGRWCPAEG